MKSIFLSQWHFRKNLFVQLLANVQNIRVSKNLQIWAYYKLGMFNYALKVHPQKLNCRAYVAKIVSYAALGEFEKAKELHVKFESSKFCNKYFTMLYKLLVPYMGAEILETKKENSFPNTLKIALLCKYHKKQEALMILDDLLKKKAYRSIPELLLLKSNLIQNNKTKLTLLNKYLLQFHLNKVRLKEKTTYLNIDNLSINNVKKNHQKVLVSIIMTSYNSSKHISTALDSLLTQSYTNLEIIVVDDCSSDKTVEIIQKYSKKDKRIKLIQLKHNVGTYVAKNIALQIAKGSYITCHDSDDYSHPLKIELQVQPLIKNKNLVASISNWIRIDAQGNYYSRHIYPFSRMNLSSLMFHKETILNKIGYYDSVRTGADSEFYARIVLVFGKKNILRIKKPLSLGSHRENSLMNAKDTGYNTLGISNERLSYWEAWNAWHIQETANKRIPFLERKQDKRKFQAPKKIIISKEKIEKLSYE